MPNKPQTGNKIHTARSKTANINKTGVTGIYGAHPTLPEYGQSMGKDTIPTKFAEGSIGTAKRSSDNKPSAKGTAPFGSTVKQTMGKSTIITTKNRYSSAKSPLKGKK
jgi:hypothetical protein